MGKDHHHKKRLKSEKAKTKLRVKTEKTKFLPKGLNVTKTDFKVKQIVVPQQFREHAEGELLSRRKLNLKDILSRLRHHNVNVKHDCCDELKEVLDHCSDDVLGQNLAQILQGVAPLLLDREKKIRRDAIQILDKILGKVSLANIVPFFGILSSYLRCSMTNIDRSVQEDSLYFLDALLKHAPTLVATDGDKILPNLFALISKLRNDAHSGRTLTVNLGSKLTSVKWRIQVLRRLHAFLEAITENVEKKQQSTNNGIVVFADDSNRIPIFYNPFANSIELTNLTGNVKHTEKVDVITRNFETLTSLLNDVWMEVVPEKNYELGVGDGTGLKSEAGAALTCILHLLNLLTKYKARTDEMGNARSLFTPDCRNFLNSVISMFPFTQAVEKKKRDANQRMLDVNADPRCTKENLMVAHQFCLLHRVPKGKTFLATANCILRYVNDCLSNRNYVKESEVRFLLPIARSILFQNYSSWEKAGVNVSDFLEKFVSFFDRTGPNFQCSDEIFEVLCGLQQLPHVNRSEGYRRWLSGLPKMLCQKTILPKILDMLLLIAKQSIEPFLLALVIWMPDILGNLDAIHILGCDTEDHAKLKILHLFYYAPCLNPSSKETLRTFSKNCNSNFIPAIECLLMKQ